MIIETYKNYDPKATLMIKPREIFRENFSRMNSTIRVLELLKPEIKEEYLVAFKKYLDEEVEDSIFNMQLVDLDELSADLPLYENYPEIRDLIVKLFYKYINLPKDALSGLDEFEGIWIEALKGWMLVPYYRTKAFTDVLGREEGIKFWKKMVDYIYDEVEEKGEEIWPPIDEVVKGWLEGGRSGEYKGFDYTIVIFDDNKALLKFDRCCVHESMEDIEDQEIVHISRCYSGGADFRTQRVRRKTITQTLHCGEFCDEFYFDSSVHPDTKHPPAEFTRQLGKEDPAKLIEEYKGKL